MSSISEYQSLEENGSLVDRRKYILSLKDKSEIEQYLRNSLTKSLDHLQMLIFLSNITKNEKNFLSIFENDSLAIQGRILAGKSWIKLQKDPKTVEEFLVQTIQNKTHPR